jgi:alcohol dehydrogenase (NADP+)
MKTLTFNNGDSMPMLGLGTWKSKPGDVYEAVKTAIRLGYRHIDCARIYGNEAEIGKALAESLQAGVATRQDLWITSKLWNDSHHPEDVQAGLEATLKDLQLEYLDLFLMHWPVALKQGASFPLSAEKMIGLDVLPLGDTWAAMETLVERGLCRHIGVSNFSQTKLKALWEGSRLKPEMNQVEMHPYLQQSALLTFCQQRGVPMTAYSPLGSPDRPDSQKATDEPVLMADPVIVEIANQHQASSAQVLIAWALQRGTVVIPKSVTPARIEQNLAAATMTLSEAEMATIAKLDRHRRYVDGTIWVVENGPYTLKNLWDD